LDVGGRYFSSLRNDMKMAVGGHRLPRFSHTGQMVLSRTDSTDCNDGRHKFDVVTTFKENSNAISKGNFETITAMRLRN
jgi:hypothetical protein